VDKYQIYISRLFILAVIMNDDELRNYSTNS